MDETVFVQKKRSSKVVVSKGSSNVRSKFSDANFCMTFVVYVSADKYVTSPLSIIPGKRLNREVLRGCDI